MAFTCCKTKFNQVSLGLQILFFFFFLFNPSPSTKFWIQSIFCLFSLLSAWLETMKPSVPLDTCEWIFLCLIPICLKWSTESFTPTRTARWGLCLQCHKVLWVPGMSVGFVSAYLGEKNPVGHSEHAVPQAHVLGSSKSTSGKQW